MIGQIRYMRDKGFDVHVVSGPGAELDYLATREHTDPSDKVDTRAVSVGRSESAS